MTLTKGDHLVIKRDGKILTEKDEAYHEFIVIEDVEYSWDEENRSIQRVTLRVVK